MKRLAARPIGAVLRDARRLKSVTQVELAERSGVQQSYISGLEHGRRKAPSWDVVVSLLSALDLTPLEFFELTGLDAREPGPDDSDAELELLIAEVRRLPPRDRGYMVRFLRCCLQTVRSTG